MCFSINALNNKIVLITTVILKSDEQKHYFNIVTKLYYV